MKKRGNNAWYLLFLSSLLLVLASCTLPSMIPPNPANPVRKVAVLPMYNATNDIDGPQMVRESFAERLPKWHYQVQPLNETDQILRDQMGITLGSQLELTNPQTLGKTLGVDGVIYGYLLNFDHITTGVYNAKKVRGGFRLVDVRTGMTVWARGVGVKRELTSAGRVGRGLAAARDMQEEREGIEPFRTIKGLEEVPGVVEWRLLESTEEEDVGRAAMFSLGEKLVGKITGTGLYSETTDMLDIVFEGFLIGPGIGTAEAYPMPELPAFEMKGMTVPAYMEFGEKDFISDIVITAVFKKDNKETVVKGRLARRGESFRSDLDMTEAMKEADKDAPVLLRRWTFIEREKEKKSYTLYPEMKKYLEAELTPSEVERPKITKERLGEETVDGKRCVKYRVAITEKDGSSHTGLIWEARDLADFVIRSEFEEKDYKHVMELKNLKLVTPQASLFQIPGDYVKAANFMELFAEERK